jgi:cytochrome c-type biogenesis protein CcmH
MRFSRPRWRLALLPAWSLGLFLLGAGAALAVEPSEKLADPGLEARAREIGRGLRCLVCQNQTIDDSNAPLARDLRLVVRERLTAGDSDDAVVEYVHSRYGDFVLMRPPLRADTYLLWFGPLLLAALFGLGLYLKSRGRAASAPEGLSAAERARVAAILNELDERSPPDGTRPERSKKIQ